MKDFYFKEITVKQAISLLAYVIHAVSKICIDCGEAIVDRSTNMFLARGTIEGKKSTI